MKAHGLATFLEMLASSIGGGQALSSLVSALRACPATTSASKRIAAIQESLSLVNASVSSTAPKLSSAAHVVDIASTLISIVGTKAAVAAIGELQSFVGHHSESSASALDLVTATASAPKAKSPKIVTLNDAKVEYYVRALLSSAPGLESFGDAIAALKADAEVRAAEMKAIAQKVGATPLDSDTRPKALKRIERDHQIVLATRAKAEALRGNTSV